LTTTGIALLKGEHKMATKQEKPLFGSGAAAPTTTRRRASGGYGIWEYSQGAWSLRRAVCPVGYTPGAPPVQEGRFEGELIRKYCEPVPFDVPVMAAGTD
jgi:hypothetical protein